MSLIKKEASAEQIEANHANSRHSTGPRSEQGKAVASRNARKPRTFAKIAARSLCALRERPTEFERMRQALSEAMAPRDAWEVAWVQDIAILRWRLARLQRAEVGVLAVRKRKLAGERKRNSLPTSGLDDLNLRRQIPVVGFTGLPDSPWKFQQVLDFLHQLRQLVRFADCDKEGVGYFDLLYGKQPGAVGAVLKGGYEALGKRQEEKKFKDGDITHRALLDAIDREIAHYEQSQALYMAERRDDDPVRADADLLLPRQELDDLMRYETHLEVQIERKLRQFYARRHEATVRPAETVSAAVEESTAGALVRQASANSLGDSISLVPHSEGGDTAFAGPHLEGNFSATSSSTMALGESHV